MTSTGGVRDPKSIGVLDGFAFLAELALLTALCVAGARIGSGWLAVALAVLLPAAAISLWGLFLAPRATHRLRNPARLVAKLALVAVAAALLAIAEEALWAAVFLVLAGSALAVGEMSETRTSKP